MPFGLSMKGGANDRFFAKLWLRYFLRSSMFSVRNQSYELEILGFKYTDNSSGYMEMRREIIRNGQTEMRSK